MPYLAPEILCFIGMVDNNHVNILEWRKISDLGLFGIKKLVIDELECEQP